MASGETAVEREQPLSRTGRHRAAQRTAAVRLWGGGGGSKVKRRITCGISTSSFISPANKRQKSRREQGELELSILIPPKHSFVFFFSFLGRSANRLCIDVKDFGKYYNDFCLRVKWVSVGLRRRKKNSRGAKLNKEVWRLWLLRQRLLSYYGYVRFGFWFFLIWMILLFFLNKINTCFHL